MAARIELKHDCNTPVLFVSCDACKKEMNPIANCDSALDCNEMLGVYGTDADEFIKYHLGGSIDFGSFMQVETPSGIKYLCKSCYEFYEKKRKEYEKRSAERRIEMWLEEPEDYE